MVIMAFFPLNSTLPENTTLSASDIINLDPINELISKGLKWGAIIIVVYIIYKIITAFFSAVRERRIRITYKNTKEIKKRLDRMEKKLEEIYNKLIGKKKK